MAELFQLAGKPVLRGSRVFHNAHAHNLGKRWVEVIDLTEPQRAQVRVLEGGGKGAVPVIEIANLQWQEPTPEEQTEELYARLSKGSDLAQEALALLRNRDSVLKQAAEVEAALHKQIVDRDALLAEQDGVLTRCYGYRAYFPEDLVVGISKAAKSLRTLVQLTKPSTARAQVFPFNGTGKWHVAVLDDRIWKDVSGDLPSKHEARKWAKSNGYVVENS